MLDGLTLNEHSQIELSKFFGTIPYKSPEYKIVHMILNDI
jgi:hypothetical protein